MLAVVAVAVLLWEPVWWWATTKKVAYYPGPGGGASTSTVVSRDRPLHKTAQVRGFKTVKRWSPSEQHGVARVWYVESGFVAREDWYEDGGCVRTTKWAIDGTVLHQSSRTGFHSEPPWLWDATDQTSPSDPQWIAEHGK